MPFPLIKLGALLVKQMSKPMKTALKSKAKTSPTFRKMCMYPATLYHRYEVNVKMTLLGLGESKNVQPLDEEAAVQLGADMLGEAFLYSFLVGIIVFETWYSSRNSEAKEEEKKKYFQSLEDQITELGLSAARQDAEIRQLQRIVGELESENYALKQKCFHRRQKDDCWVRWFITGRTKFYIVNAVIDFNHVFY